VALRHVDFWVLGDEYGGAAGEIFFGCLVQFEHCAFQTYFCHGASRSARVVNARSPST
jgi:hypothetical protein